MDVQLQELIDKIKTEGVEEAKAKAEQLVEEANEQAKAIITKARNDAKRIVDEAEQEAQKALRSGKDAIAQAARDLLLGVSRRLERMFAQVIETTAAEALHGEILERAILRVFERIGSEQEGVSLSLSEADTKALSKGFMGALSERIKSGVEITPSQKVSAGFRVSVDGGSAYYSFTPKEIAEVLSAFLNPKLAAILEDALSGE